MAPAAMIAVFMYFGLLWLNYRRKQCFRVRKRRLLAARRRLAALCDDHRSLPALLLRALSTISLAISFLNAFSFIDIEIRCDGSRSCSTLTQAKGRSPGPRYPGAALFLHRSVRVPFRHFSRMFGRARLRDCAISLRNPVIIHLRTI